MISWHGMLIIESVRTRMHSTTSEIVRLEYSDTLHVKLVFVFFFISLFLVLILFIDVLVADCLSPLFTPSVRVLLTRNLVVVSV